MEAKNLADIYETPLIEWSTIEDRLALGITQAPGAGGPDRHTCWLATINPDGTPHVNGIGAIWVDGTFWFETGEHSRKGKNLARDARCTLSLATHEFDIVLEGRADRETDPAMVAQLAATWAAGGWPVSVDESGAALTAAFSAPSAGRPPWHVYRITPHTGTAVLTVDPGGATRWRF